MAGMMSVARERLPSGSGACKTGAMRTDLDHLPGNKQRELARVVQLIFEEFEDALVLATNDWKKKGRVSRSSSTVRTRAVVGSMNPTRRRATSPTMIC